MTSDTRLHYDRLPAVAPSYLRAATTLSGGLPKGGTIPEIVAEVPDIEVRAEALARYRKVCGFAHSRQLPVTYPHVLAFPVHMAVMTHKRFPLKLLGLVHLRNDINQYRAIDTDETLHLEVAVGGHRDVAKGVEFDLITRVRDTAGEVIWDETGTMLSITSGGPKSSGDKAKKKPKRQGPGFEPEQENRWRVPADIGRRYAGAAGDYNPIHLSPASAKLFGFPRAIATGMWLAAHAAAQLEPELNTAAYTLSLAFKKPVFLPSEPRFVYTLSAGGAQFALTDDSGDTLHLSGDVSYR